MSPGGWGSQREYPVPDRNGTRAFRKDLCAADLGVCSGQAESEELRSGLTNANVLVNMGWLLAHDYGLVDASRKC